MTTLTLELTDEQARRWEQEAKRRNLTTLQFVVQCVEARLSAKNKSTPSDFTDAADYVFQRNSELYRRLA